jgi:exosortase/archaeosortase family protein
MKNCIEKIIILIILTFTILMHFENRFFSELTSQYVATSLSYFIEITPVTAENILFLKMNDHIVPILISFECTGFMFISIFILTIFMMPNISLKHRLVSLLLVPLIYLANIARIIMGLTIGIYTNIHTMILFHDTVGQVFLLIFTVLLLLIFLNISGYIKLKRDL